MGELDHPLYLPQSLKTVLSNLFLGMILLSLGATLPAWAVTISGTVKTIDQETTEEIPVVGARVSALDVDDQERDRDICDAAGEFSLEVPPKTLLHLLVRGPIGSDEYADTYTSFFDSGTEDIEGMKGQIIGKSELEAILALNDPLVDERKGSVLDVLEARVYSREGISDLVPAAGSRVNIMDPNGNEIEAPVVYMDETGDWDPSLRETSSVGRYVIYNVDIRRVGELDAEDVSLAARRELFAFPLSEARLYPHTSQGGSESASVVQQEKVTVANLEGWGIEVEGENSNLGCFISTLAEGLHGGYSISGLGRKRER